MTAQYDCRTDRTGNIMKRKIYANNKSVIGPARWFCWDKNAKLHHYTITRPNAPRFALLRCRDDQLYNGDVEFMIENNLTL